MRTTILTAIAATIMTLAPATAANADQPYGGCKEASQAPRSAGAAHCRSHGWVIRRDAVIGPRGWVRSLRGYGQCPSEDWWGCYWDARVQGNGEGHSFVAFPNGRVRFVIPRSLDRF